MDLRRHLIPGIALALVLLAVVVIAVSRSDDRDTAPVPSVQGTDSSATTTTEAAIPPAESTEEREPAEMPTLIVREEARETQTPSTLRVASEPAATATLVVDGTRYALTAPPGATLKEALDRLDAESDFAYAYRNYSGLGAFVTSINGRASTGDRYWILYVNGAKSAAGISATRIRSGDTFEWKLEAKY